MESVWPQYGKNHGGGSRGNPGPLHQMIGSVGGEVHLSLVRLIIRGADFRWINNAVVGRGDNQATNT